MGQLLRLVINLQGEITGIEASGSPEAVEGMLLTQLTSLEVVAETQFAGQDIKARMIAHLTVLTSALLDALPEEHARLQLVKGRFQSVVRQTHPFMREQLEVAQYSGMDVLRALRQAGDEYGMAYFSYLWWKHMPKNEPHPKPI